MASPTGSSSVRAAVALAAVALAALPAASAAGRAPFGACLVTASRGADASLDDGAAAGLREAEHLGVAVRLLRPASPASYVHDLGACVAGGAGLTVGVGYGMAAGVDLVATASPSAHLAIVGVDVRSLPHRPRNVTGLLFHDEQSGYLAGYAAGLWARRVRGRAVGAVGGIEIPPVDRSLAGFQFGARAAYPGVTVFVAYSHEVSGAAACAKVARNQLANGSVVEFQVAGACGLGAIAEARARNAVAIGSGADQSSLGPWVLTSALERVDVAVRAAILAARRNTLRGGANTVLGAAQGGIGYGMWSPRVPQTIRAAVARQYALLRSREVPGIPVTVR